MQASPRLCLFSDQLGLFAFSDHFYLETKLPTAGPSVTLTPLSTCGAHGDTVVTFAPSLAASEERLQCTVDFKHELINPICVP